MRTHTYTHSISKLAVQSNWVTVEFGLTEGRLVEHEIRALYSSLAGERRLTETERKGVRICVCVCYLWQVKEGKAKRLGGSKGLSTVAVLSGGKERKDCEWTWEKGRLTVTSVNIHNCIHPSHNIVLKASFGECDSQPRNLRHLSLNRTERIDDLIHFNFKWCCAAPCWWEALEISITWGLLLSMSGHTVCGKCVLKWKHLR